ncbi:penicillin-binding protein 2 [Maritimibacter sp. 55A14]|uniref:penicillin-binding protein 2 n=1 Tax=Maritimibacter sp. 55A14 TaxID=2174844 RepID=UPI000D604257|nr:penicillin-binding protein 2 [Maritimibacter sp. 55A14]PWE32124.1 penicillin-binding protein 2 [Maritimibacter sp. 55A14]
MRQPGKDTEESVRRITRRGLILGSAQAGFIALLAGRMRYLQVNQADEFRLLAEDNRIRIRLLAPARGLIFDRQGVLIAENQQNYRIVVVREETDDLEAVLTRLRKLVDLDDALVDRAIEEMRARSPFVPYTLVDRLAWEEVAAVAVNAPSLPGITAEVGLSRHYPLGPDFTHVVGYVGPVSDYDLGRIEDPDPLLQIPNFQIGKYGAEARLEPLLRGKAGNRRIEVNAAGREMRELDRTPGTPGSDVQLTVDYALQNFAQARMAGESAAAVVIDVRNGDLVAVGSAPTYDPNLFVRGISVGDYKALTENKFRPLASKPVQGIYPPGSTFKMVVALAALEAGVISPGETVWCPGFKQTSGRRFHCWKRGGHGHMNMHNSLKQSCDVYYYEVAERVGIDRIAAMARRLGIGTRHALPLSGIAEGLAPDKAWKQSRHGEAWLLGDTLNVGIGQGYVLASPLQLAVMAARIASGTAVAPRLVKSVDGVDTGTEAEPLGISAAALNAVRRGMFGVSNEVGGTARRSRIAAAEMEMAGKTGTSQVRNITADERRRGVFRNEDLPWERRDHALFVCFAPFEAPRYAVSVVVEHGGGGSVAAAPIARDVLLYALHGGLPPLEAYPAEQRREVGERFDALDLRGPLKPPPTDSRSRA